MERLIYAIIFLMLLNASGCSLFKNKRGQEIRERLERIQEEINRKSDSIREERFKLYDDSAYNEIQKTIDSLKHSSDSLEKVIKKNIEELKRKNKTK